LPPPLETNEEGEHAFLRAVVFITEETTKGTARSPQEYLDPLFVLTGEQYANLSFEGLHDKVCAALRRGNPRLVAQMHTPEGRVKLLFEDGTSHELDME
jgi:hypothetical protein